ncbi:MAG: toxin-activating lysine-acyltransferase [Alphaproteobacteria bacterium GM202ARS2]|nr:toxin-activating lysine-acyltransferase [Alphaproteobacteria bacterium GM202ARS2]
MTVVVDKKWASRLWIIDFLAPFGGARAVIANLLQKWWLPQSVANSMRITANGRRLQQWTPAADQGPDQASLTGRSDDDIVT